MAGDARAPLFVSIDFGASVTVAAGMRAGGEPEVVQVDGTDPSGIYLPSAVYRAHDGEIWVGRAAVEAIATDPLGGQLTLKSAIRAGQEVETLTHRSIPLVALIARVLARAHDAAIAQFGDVPVEVTLTCPVAWAPDGPHAVRRRVLRAAAQLAGIPGAVGLINEAEAAAHHHGDGELPIAEGELCSIYDIGASTCDIAVLRRDQGRLTVVALAEAEVGGDLFDWRLYEHVLDHLEREAPDAAEALRLVDTGEEDPVWRRRQVALAGQVRGAKERLSDVDRVTLEFPDRIAPATVVSRETFEGLIRDDIETTRDEFRSCLRRGLESAGDHRGLCAAYLVGGTSRMPLVADVVNSTTDVTAHTADDPRTAVALGAVLALESRRAARPRRRAVRGEELHARSLIACAVHQRHAFLVHRDPTGAAKLTRLDLRRGAADRSIDLPDLPRDEAVSIAAHGGGVVVALPRTVWARDLELTPIFGLDLEGDVVMVEAGPTCIWIVYAEPPGPGGRRDRRRLRLRTIGVPSADRDEETERDVGIGEHVTTAATDGPPAFWSVASGVPGRHELFFAMPTRGLGTLEQSVFAAAEDGRMRKVQTRKSAPWLADRRLTAGGDLWLEVESRGRRLHAHLGATHLLTVETDRDEGVDAVPVVTAGSLYLAIGSRAAPPWDLLRVDVARRTESDRQLAGIYRQAAVDPPWRVSHQRGLFSVHRGADSFLLAGQAAVEAENGAWLSTRQEGRAAVLRVDPIGVRATLAVPAGAVPVGSGAGRLYVRTAAAELRSVPWEAG
ncbi:Hsp70 family protein [Solirubrobacter ginsenosidimutans]|uniref:Hsp70 family protein n=1 Tax=Solirubrobacter ginsenosidimutans TaxID=490573 RepID=A0A9X3MQB0_9ACTN|nr:Hsp70 family protein [Solirubrobacter ginsenosidimutans]MDA0159806.1 Hsp70 family protein [Solirubrobacter ginsenosidimutans]